ncbi:hypothetical protein niasHS_013914 [Heterodera schachtii]|uniref:EamA domain-containing protein n=1 Tax=Heterodera schachtii TaxID=97005 RepID=A0ABD2IKG0_HETSC
MKAVAIATAFIITIHHHYRLNLLAKLTTAATTTTTEQRQNVATTSRNRRRSKSGGNIKDTINADQRQEEEEEGICLMSKTDATITTTAAAMAIDDGTTQRKNGGITERVPLASSNIRQFLINFLVIVGVAVSWALAVQFRKSTLVIDPSHFYAPFSLVWLSTAFMTICLPVFLLFAFVSGKNVRMEQRNALKVLRSPNLGQFGIWHSLLCPLLFLALWTAINYAYAQALGLISAGAASSIMSASTALVWVLSWALLRERFSTLKFVAVLVAMVGVLLVALDNEFAANGLGICLAIFSTVLASFYKVLFKLCVGNATLGQVSLFMTVLGVQNLLLNTPLSALLVHLDWDRVEWAHVPWSPLIGSALLGLVFNFLVNFGIALLNPLVISIGMLFGMPLSACIDVLFRAMPISVLFLIGSLLITLSFVLIAFPIELLLFGGICDCFCRRSTEIELEEDGKNDKNVGKIMPSKLSSIEKKELGEETALNDV